MEKYIEEQIQCKLPWNTPDTGVDRTYLGKTPLFTQKFPEILMLEKCEFCENRGFINVNFVNDEISKM